jgi:signal transduction histidine kinase
MRQLRRHEKMQAARHELQLQLNHSQRLESLGTLAGGIAHDLNNTLVPVLAITPLLMKRAAEGSPLRANLALIHQSGIRACELVKQILAFGRKEIGERKPVDIQGVLEEAVAMLRSSIPATISISTKLEKVPLILADPTQVHQVIINVVANAGHAIGEKFGEISITMAPAKSGDAVQITISDDGCGMPREVLDRIYEPFFTTKSVGKGTGLGMSVVHGIVTSHGGTIDAKSELGKGTVFTLRLPTAIEVRKAAA